MNEPDEETIEQTLMKELKGGEEMTEEQKKMFIRNVFIPNLPRCPICKIGVLSRKRDGSGIICLKCGREFKLRKV